MAFTTYPNSGSTWQADGAHAWNSSFWAAALYEYIGDEDSYVCSAEDRGLSESGADSFYRQFAAEGTTVDYEDQTKPRHVTYAYNALSAHTSWSGTGVGYIRALSNSGFSGGGYNADNGYRNLGPRPDDVDHPSTGIMIADVEAYAGYTNAGLQFYTSGHVGVEPNWITAQQGPGYQRHGGASFAALFGDGQARSVQHVSTPEDWIAIDVN